MRVVRTGDCYNSLPKGVLIGLFLRFFVYSVTLGVA